MTSPFGCAEAIGCDNCECKEECLDEQSNIYEEKRSNIGITQKRYDTMPEEEHLHYEYLAEKKQKFLEFRDEYKELNNSIHFIKTALAQYGDWYDKNSYAYRNLKYGLQQIKKHENELFEEYQKKRREKI